MNVVNRRLDGASLENTRHLTIGGLPGTGTTTACARLEKDLGLPYVYAGQVFRDMATARSMSLEAFSRYAETHPEFDRELDDQQIALLRGPPILLEGRLSGFLAYREKLPAFKTWFTCDPWVRAERIVKREGGETEDRMAEMRRREESEKKRYLEFYGFDITDLSCYDIVLDTTNVPPEIVVRRVIDAYRAPPPSPKKWYEFWKS